MEQTTNSSLFIDNQIDGERHNIEQRSSVRYNESNDNGDDEDTTWSVGSNALLNRSNHDDDGLVFPSEHIFIRIEAKISLTNVIRWIDLEKQNQDWKKNENYMQKFVKLQVILLFGFIELKLSYMMEY